MAITRKKILEKIDGKQKGIDYHLNDHIPGLIAKADRGLVEYWRKEVHRLIDEMDSWAQRLSNHEGFLKLAAENRQRLDAMLDQQLRDLDRK